MDAARAASLSERLRESGLRATRPRLAVLALLEELGGHHSADELVELLVGRGLRLPRASVYGVLSAIADAGLIQRADVGPGRAVYELATTPHHHFVCTSCGQIQDVPAGRRAPLQAEFPEVEGQIVEARILFRGSCRQCLPVRKH